jgi:DNA-binding transcriptional LysR family regulator
MKDVHDLASFDLNLLLALDHLVHTGSVTQAAGRMGVTQSAMSHTLRRLRTLFDDPLLVRTGSTMSPTPRAEALAIPIRAALAQLERALHEPEGFHPGRSTRAFRITAPDLFDLLMLPRIWSAFAQEAPGVRLASVPAPAAIHAALASGDLDLAVVPVQPELEGVGHAEILRRSLFRDRMCAWVREGHPSAGGLPLDAYLSAAHVLVSPTGRGPGVVDHVLAQRGLRRRVVVRVPHFATAVAMVRSSDLVLTGPASLEALDAPLVGLDLPFEVPEHGIALAWHRRVGADAGHRWLRERLTAIATMHIATDP